MARINLDKLSVKELQTLADDVALALVERKDEERAAIKEKIAALAASNGFAVEELFGNARGPKVGKKVAPKYRNPDDPTATWTGRGRQPLWFAAAVRKGVKVEKLLIK